MPDDGIGTKKKSESRCNGRGGTLWEKGVMRTHLPMALQNAVLFLFWSLPYRWYISWG